MTYPYKIGINRCIRICNNENNPYFKTCLSDFTVKSLSLLSKEFIFKIISFHQSCNCDYLLDEKVYNNKQQFNKNKCRCKCLKIKKCKNGYSWNINNCRCEMKKIAKSISIEECDVEIDELKNISKNKTIKCNKIIKK